MSNASIPVLTPKRVRELLDYDPLTGVLTWRSRPIRLEHLRTDKSWNTLYAGSEAGTLGKHGAIYIVLTENGVRLRLAAHRFAWAHYYEEWPLTEIDHRNRKTADNRIANLRLASHVENSMNRGLHKDSTSGVTGVSWNKKRMRWEAYINADGRPRVALGYFTSKQAAIETRRVAEQVHFGEFRPIWQGVEGN